MATDLIDRADSEIEHELAEALRARKPPGPEPTGACLYCDAGLAAGRRWCGRECEAAWEFEQERKAQNAGEN